MTAVASGDGESDFGWDDAFDEDVHQLLNAAHSPDDDNDDAPRPLGPVAAPHAVSHGLRLARLCSTEAVADDDHPAAVVDAAVAAAARVEYPDLSSALADLDGAARPEGEAADRGGSTALSPLARFRTAPRKPLSVSDLTAGAWCELQYEYTLTRLPGGRRTRTAAMRAGTRVHAQLEDEVHTTVRVDVATREDVFGLRLWNLIQGLRTLRETGLTRELEIWGVVEIGGGSEGEGEGEGEGGVDRRQLVNGVIDALSYHNPDPTLEASLQRSPRADTETTSPQRARITDFFPSPSRQKGTAAEAPVATSTPAPAPSGHPKIYITDVKTRGTPRLPSGAAVRPTKIQLFLYHRFLTDLASDRLDFGVVLRRYGLEPAGAFSDAFLAQMGSLHEEIFAGDAGLRYRTLESLVALLRDEVRQTFPAGASSVGDLVAVEYRLRPTTGRRHNREHGRSAVDSASPDGPYDPDSPDGPGDPDETRGGRCIGTNVMPVDNAVLDRYLARYLAWWRGARPAVGVEIEEAALKCGYCEFAADCDWRRERDAERVQRVRAKLAAAAAAAAAGGTPAPWR